uniref:Uncharacterized protein n=1 Tax=Rhizophora mucronata TaxID=61149 RepID=A0A2P2R304_RHIMU
MFQDKNATQDANFPPLPTSLFLLH